MAGRFLGWFQDSCLLWHMLWTVPSPQNGQDWERWGVITSVIRTHWKVKDSVDLTKIPHQLTWLFFRCSVMSDTLQLHGLQHVRLLCPPLSPVICSNSWPSSQWCYLTISSSAAPFSFCLQSFPALEFFPMSRLFFASGGQSTGASASVLPMNIQGWSPSGLTGLLFLLSKDSQESSPAPQFESLSSSVLSLLCGPTVTLVYDYWKSHGSDNMDLFRHSDVSAF